MGNNDKVLVSFYKRLYEISQNFDKVNGAYEPYIHKFDSNILKDLKISDFKNKTFKFLNNIKERTKFNVNCTFRF